SAAPQPPTLPRRPVLALLAVVVISYAVAPSGGMYTHPGFFLALAALALALTAAVLPEWRWPVPQRLPATVLVRSLQFLILICGCQFVAALAGAHFLRDGSGVAIVAAVVAAGTVLLLGILYLLKPRLPSPALACLAAATVLLSGTPVLTAE